MLEEAQEKKERQRSLQKETKQADPRINLSPLLIKRQL